MLIYKIINLINNKIYIGLTDSTIEKRWKWHLVASNTKDYYLYNSIRKYGKENFKIEQIDKAYSETEMKSKEQYWIAKYQSNNRKYGFNSTGGGEFGRPNEEVILKTMKTVRRKGLVNKYCNVKFDKTSNLWEFKTRRHNKTVCIGGFKSEIDAAIARDIKMLELWKNYDIKDILNFPENYEKYVNNEIKMPERAEKRVSDKKSKYHFVLWDKDLKYWYVCIRNKNIKKTFKFGMYNVEEEAAEVADFYSIKYNNETKKINFFKNIPLYQSVNYKFPKTVKQKKKKAPYKDIGVDKRGYYCIDLKFKDIRIRKHGFKDVQDAKNFRDGKYKEFDVQIPD